MLFGRLYNRVLKGVRSDFYQIFGKENTFSEVKRIDDG